MPGEEHEGEPNIGRMLAKCRLFSREAEGAAFATPSGIWGGAFASLFIT